MPQALGGLLLGGLGALGITGTAATIAAGALSLAVGVGLSMLVSILFRPKQPKPSDGQTVIRQSAAPRLRSYGRVKIAGTMMFANTKEGFFHRVFAMGSGEIDAIEERWIDDEQVEVDGSGDVTDSKYIRNGVSRVRIVSHLGDDSGHFYGGLGGHFPDLWTEDHLGKGIPHTYVRLRQTSQSAIMDMFPQLGNTLYRQVHRGAKVPNVESGEITAASWSDNAARVILDYLTHKDGLKLSPSWIENEIENWEEAIADCADSIDLKDGSPPGTEERYRIWNSYRFDERPADVLARLMQAADAQVYPTPNRGLAIKIGKWEAPTVTIDDDAIIAFSEIGRGRDILTTANTIRAQFTSPDHDYLETDADPWVDADDVTARGEFATDIELFAVPSHSQARRLMKVAAYRANPKWTGTLTCNLRALPVMGERFINVVIGELDIEETFEVLGVRMLIEEGTVLKGVEIDVQSLPEEAYNWNPETEEGTAPASTEEIEPENEIPAPTGFALSAGPGNGPMS